MDKHPFVHLLAGFGPYSEVAFFHKPTKTLIVTDAVVQIPGIPPKVCSSAESLPLPASLPSCNRILQISKLAHQVLHKLAQQD